MTVSSKSHQGKEQEEGEVEGIKEKEKGSYLRIIPRLCLEDKMN
jgi:hypothetical protein